MLDPSTSPLAGSGFVQAPDGFAARVASIRSTYPSSNPDMVADVVRAVLSTMAGDLNASEASLLAEVEELGMTISAAKAEIKQLRADDISAQHIPSATDELDAIITHTASATDAILETCETLDNLANSVSPEAAAILSDATTRIYEACSFQDITGQRITKVVGTLKTIELKVTSIIDAFGRERIAFDETPVAPPTGEAALLNGPQLPAAAMDQSDIDKLLASFD